MRSTPTPFTTITKSAELAEVWRQMMGRGGFSKPSLWVIFFDSARRLQQVVLPIDDIAAEPEPKVLNVLTSVLVRSLDEQMLGSVAFLLSRPGPRQMTSADRTWARALAALSDERLRHWPIHLATCDDVRVFAADDLVGVA